MSLERIKNTNLWINTLGYKNDQDEFKDKREELRASFIDFREKVSSLVSTISGDFPTLTLHDISHLDALWEIADLLCGVDYPINPLEAYVFGGAILLHDAALSLHAYEQGLDGIRETVIWRDTFANLKTNSNTYEPELKQHADFVAVRSLHASQAEKLAEKEFKNSANQQSLYLIENSNLRQALGKLIGLIASSHHWSIENVSAKLRDQVNAPSGYPRIWRIDPKKIACMLRCADAAHIDNERAPDFLHALIKKKGISLSHWQAQNKLSLAIDDSDDTNSTLLFTSSQPFHSDESDAWWVAYDAVCMIEKEIRASNALLESKQPKTQQFQIKRIKGIESTELMAKYIEAEGWTPCSAEIHVGNIENLVKSLGGEQLYGKQCDKLEIMIRELIQNARDAIHARREIEQDFEGKIDIRLKQDDCGFWLLVEDDGIGMSRRVLTGPLLDFGTSFWTSSLIHSEFPGLRSSKFKAVGRFGIGFYSVFMGAKKIFVSSKQWDKGLSDTWQLKFNSGLSLRPLLQNDAPNDFKSGISTQVKMLLEPDLFNSDVTFTIKRNQEGADSIDVSLKSYISAICGGLDVSVFFKSSQDAECINIHTDILKQENNEDWLKNISFAEYRSPEFKSLVKSYSSRLRPIMENGCCHGLAAISISSDTEEYFLRMDTVGGLANDIRLRRDTSYVGYLDHLPSSARRDAYDFSASRKALTDWAEEQLKILLKEDLHDVDRCFLAFSLYDFNVDPISEGKVLIAVDEKYRACSFDTLAQITSQFPITFIKSYRGDYVDHYAKFSSLPNRMIIHPLRGGNFLSLKLERGEPQSEISLLGCLFRAIKKRGLKPKIKIEKNVGESLMGSFDAFIITSEA